MLGVSVHHVSGLKDCVVMGINCSQEIRSTCQCSEIGVTVECKLEVECHC